MERVRIERKPVKRKMLRPEPLPLDPRDPDILRAKQLLERDRPRRPAAT
jgi:hypothetical protein